MSDLKDVLSRWKPWIPPKQDQAFQQVRAKDRGGAALIVWVVVSRAVGLGVFKAALRASLRQRCRQKPQVVSGCRG